MAAHQQQLFRDRDKLDPPLCDIGFLDDQPPAASQDAHQLAGCCRLVEQMVKGVDHDELTSRELVLLSLIAEGKTNKEIAELLCISINTVEAHRMNLMKKLDIHNQTDLVRYAIKEGISQLEFFPEKYNKMTRG